MDAHVHSATVSKNKDALPKTTKCVTAISLFFCLRRVDIQSPLPATCIQIYSLYRVAQ